MAIKKIQITNILGGVSPTSYFGLSDAVIGLQSYLSSVAIDPDMPITDSGTGSLKTAGQIRPVAYEAFDGANVNANPIAEITTPKTSLVYVVLQNGRLISYSSTLGSETLIGTVAGDNAEGAFYYNNFIYITGTGASKNDASRYGPLDGAASLTNAVWTGATLGSQTALTNNTYPSIRGSGTIPQHVGHVHLDNKAYFLDYKDGQGLVHYIKTTKTTAEGDTNDTSVYNALDLPFGFLPTSLDSFGEDIVVSGIQTTSTLLDQGNAALFFWDTVSPSFYKQVYIDEPVITAVKVVNGVLNVFAGKLAASNTAGNGYSVYQYLGGSSFRELASFDEGWPPLHGAVDANGDRLVWGSCVTNPTNAAVVWSYGSKDSRIPAGLHCIARATASASATDGLVTSLGFLQQASNAIPRMIIGWRDASNFGLDKISTTYQAAIFRSQMFNLGEPFTVKKIRLHFAQAIAANMTVIPTLYVNDESSSTALTTINSTNYAGSERTILLYPDVSGKNNFYLELVFSGTALATVVMPIEFEVEIKDDATE